MNNLEILLATFCFGSFSWGILAFFKSPAGQAIKMKMISALGFIFAASHFYILTKENTHNILGSIVAGSTYLISLITFWTAIHANRASPLKLAFSENNPQHLVTEGPYQFVRHPFYSSYILFWLGGVVATGNFYLLISVIVMTTLYSQAATLEERQFGKTSLASVYNYYRENTGKFIPKLFSLDSRFLPQLRKKNDITN